MKDQLASKRERLRRYAARTAAVYWQWLLKRVRRGEDVAAEHQWRFLAEDEETRARLAREFYSESHLALLAALGEQALPTLMGPWLDDALDSLLEDYEPEEQGPESGDRNPERRFLERLIKSQYVLVLQTRERSNDSGLTVQSYPDEGPLHGNLHERCAAGADGGCVLRLYKATGEPFTESEMAATYRAMRESFYADAANLASEESWQFEWVNEGEDDRAIFVEVDEYFTEPPGDVDESIEQVADEQQEPD